jgi:hypothetical protein
MIDFITHALRVMRMKSIPKDSICISNCNILKLFNNYPYLLIVTTHLLYKGCCIGDRIHVMMNVMKKVCKNK